MNIRLLISIIAFLLPFIINAETTMSPESKPTDYYYLSVNTESIIIETGLNGAPLIKDYDGDGISSAEPVNTWLMNGQNTLTVFLKKTADLDDNARPEASITLFLHESSSPIPKAKTILAEYHFPPRDTENSNPSLPIDVSIEFNFEKPTAVNLWKEAEAINSLSEADKTNIINLATSLQNSLINKDIDKAIELQSYKIADDALAENKPLDRIENAARKGYEWLNEQTGLLGNPIMMNSADFRICCDAKMVYISRKSGGEAIELESDDLYFDIPIYAAKINGNWKIVR